MNIFTRLILLAQVAFGSAMPVQAAPKASDKTAHDFTLTAIDGSKLPLSQYEGKLVLIVNTASKCGFTPQYAKLEAFWGEYEARGVVVLGVPSNDFGGQEPGSESEIKSFCELNYGVTFPLAAKTVVYGPNAHPFYLWAREVLGEAAAPKWNFHKYLVGRQGELLAAFGSKTSPDSVEFVRAVEGFLAR